MEKKIKDTIEKLIHIAYDYRKRGNISPLNAYSIYADDASATLVSKLSHGR